jgi:hypothetical protein
MRNFEKDDLYYIIMTAGVRLLFNFKPLVP